MIKYNGMKSEAASGNMGQLPAGPYVAKVLKVEIEGDAPDQRLILKVDVAEGYYLDFFMNKFKSQYEKSSGKYPVTYKGVYRIRIPNEKNKNALYPESDIRKFNDMIFRFEKSNEGFHWEGDETSLVGLMIGINMQDDEMNGTQFTRIGRLEIADDVRNGLVKPMKARERKGDAWEPPQPEQVQIDPKTGFTAVETDELPF